MKKDLETRFRPRYPEKYKGNPLNIIYRSRLELVFMNYLDLHPDVLEWNSEEFYIRYKSIDGKAHRYFPDMWLKKRDADGKIVEVVVEIKPYSQTIAPVRGRKAEKTFLNEVLTYGKNEAKWSAAKAYCDRRGWQFQIITEKDLGITYGKKRRYR